LHFTTPPVFDYSSRVPPDVPDKDRIIGRNEMFIAGPIMPGLFGAPDYRALLYRVYVSYYFFSYGDTSVDQKGQKTDKRP
jgi:hypothetical protein